MCSEKARSLYLAENAARSELESLRDAGIKGARVMMAKKRYQSAVIRRREYVTPSATKQAA